MRKSVTLIELIFVILILSILTSIGLSSLPHTKTISDAKILKELILEKRSNALGFQPNSSDELELVCINLDKDDLNSAEKNSKVSYIFKSNIEAIENNTEDSINRICFDSLGRPYKNNLNLSNLLKNNVIITLSFDKEINLTLYKFTGDIE